MNTGLPLVAGPCTYLQHEYYNNISIMHNITKIAAILLHYSNYNILLEIFLNIAKYCNFFNFVENILLQYIVAKLQFNK